MDGHRYPAEDVILVGEVGVKRCSRDAESLRNILHRCFLESVLIELLACRGKDGIAFGALFVRVVAH